MLDFAQFAWLSFDCYGTLIDWESGILAYLHPLLERNRCHLTDAEILNRYSEFEPREQSAPYRNYREVLASVVHDFARELNFKLSAGEAAGLAESIRNWEPFADTIAGLCRLQKRYKLAVLSNIDDELFVFSAAKLPISFDCVVTAQQMQSYKPSLRNFDALLQQLDVPRSRVLHVAESLYHDVAPARSLGIATAWVNRRQGRAAAASKLTPVTPDLEVTDISKLADLAGL
jgi:2-haloacid dehalogenase